MKYRADIDGLRSIAVLSVLAFHYNLALAGGFTGVDVFFVISGFLITQQLAGEIANGTFSILNFYDRRIRRIVPALAVVLLTTLWLGKFLLLPGDYKATAASAAYAAFGASNFFFLFNTSYFDQTSELMPLLHTWSLGVEEQFYLAWPILLAAFAPAVRNRTVAFGIGAVAALGFVTSLFWLGADSKGAFYLVLPRAWELALGALLVFLTPLSQRLGAVAIATGLALIGAGFVFAHADAFPGAAALYPCAGAALVIWPRRNEPWLSHWLGKLRPIGLISYSLYLWHWPVWVLFRHYINNGEPSRLEAVALAGISIALAVLSFRFVEKPFRQRRWSPTRTVQTGLATGAAVFCFGMYVHSADGLPERMSPAIYPLRSLDAMWGWDCPKYEQLPQLNGQYCSFGHEWATAKTKALLWGDSHAGHLAPVVQAAAQPNEGILLYTNCPASFGGRVQRLDFEGFPNFAEYCTDQRKRAIRLLRDDPSINLVILASSWSPMSHQMIGDANLSPEKRISLVASGLEDLIDETSIPGRRFLLVGSVPQLNKDPVPCAVNSLSGLLRRPCNLDATTVGFMKTYTIQTDRMLEGIAKRHANVTTLIPRDAMCDSVSCKTYINDEFIYRDASHIRRNLEPETLHELAGLIGLPAALNNQISSASQD
ncbi:MULTISPECIES: SGNH hydrolase domain-containing protein [unclassified Bradyrhizobium]|uniref:SGNH hydrolase domain-containing protein n=1 Tax=Bradyrhizobium sp. USDA 4541 TaxID=2817704 RepID=UPI0020A40D8A|nr:SGNH hydrolase domain-containing protein [Bradyrhizobium sp. USDA 4541]MCP1850634.1 peptidoglycan/LPS O-acetylase OafA/YrhL [Bradyrhizobium sp. USDA 4541]